MTATGNSSFRLLSNSSWNAAAFLVGVGLNLLVLPFVMLRLGAASFGVAGLVTACVAPALIFSTTLGQMTTRELAPRLALTERQDAKRFFGTSLSLAIVVGFLIVLILSLVGPLLARRAFNLTGSASKDLDLAFFLGALGWFCQCLSIVFVSLFTARQDYPRIASITIVTSVVSTGSMFLLIPGWPHASTYLGCQALGFLAGLIGSVAISARAIPEWLARPAIYRSPLRDLVHLGAWQAAAQGGGLIAGQIDRYLLGAFLQPQFVGFYVIVQRLEEAIYIGVLKIGEILFPFFSSLQKEDSRRVADLLFRSSWILNVLAATVLGAVIPVAGPLLYVWTGTEVATNAQNLLVLLCVGGIIGCGSNVFAFFLLANGRSRSNAIISLVTAVATVAVSVATLPRFGWQAVGWSSCIGMVAQIVATMILLRRSFSLGSMWSRAAHFVVLPLGTGIMVALILRALTGDQFFGDSPRWLQVGGAYSVAAVLIFTTIVAVSRVGPYGATCWSDLILIARRFLPVKAT